MLTYATEPIVLTGFQTSTTDADSALRSISLDPVAGTTLYDALVLASQLALVRDQLRAAWSSSSPTATRLGARRRSRRRSQPRRTRAHLSTSWASRAPAFNPGPLKQIAEETGGNYYGAADSAALDRGLQLDRRRALAHVAPRVRHLGASQRDDRPDRHSGGRVRLGADRRAGVVRRHAQAGDRGPAPRAVLRNVLGPGCLRSRRRARHLSRGRVRASPHRGAPG